MYLKTFKDDIEHMINDDIYQKLQRSQLPKSQSTSFDKTLLATLL